MIQGTAAAAAAGADGPPLPAAHHPIIAGCGAPTHSGAPIAPRGRHLAGEQRRAATSGGVGARGRRAPPPTLPSCVNFPPRLPQALAAQGPQGGRGRPARRRRFKHAGGRPALRASAPPPARPRHATPSRPPAAAGFPPPPPPAPASVGLQAVGGLGWESMCGGCAVTGEWDGGGEWRLGGGGGGGSGHPHFHGAAADSP